MRKLPGCIVLLIALPAILQFCNPVIDAMGMSQLSLPVYGYDVVRAYPHDPAAFKIGRAHV